MNGGQLPPWASARSGTRRTRVLVRFWLCFPFSYVVSSIVETAVGAQHVFAVGAFNKSHISFVLDQCLVDLNDCLASLAEGASNHPFTDLVLFFVVFTPIVGPVLDRLVNGAGDSHGRCVGRRRRNSGFNGKI